MPRKRVQIESDFLSASCRHGPLVELINQVHTLKVEVTFSSKIRDHQCVQEAQMFHSFAEPEGFGLVCCGKRARFKVRNQWRTRCSCRDAIYAHFVLIRSLFSCQHYDTCQQSPSSSSLPGSR